MQAPVFDGMRACCFTGHRPKGLPDWGNERGAGMIRLKYLLSHTVERAAQAGIRTFLAGGATGFDTIAAEAVLTWKEFYPNIRLILALPSRSFPDGWNAGDRERYNRILSLADEAHYAVDGPPSPLAMRIRNRYLVDHGDCCIAYLAAPGKSGTLYTVNYAMNREIPVYNLAEYMKD